TYTPDTLFRAVDDRLKDLAEKARAFGKEDKDKGNEQLAPTCNGCG
ncbi:MAG: hypothetical protein JRJ47_11520, partial [Deltaproteobacteria bacterium]|nr:hypothetical protein [Deltaproteobacteria bacterium]